MCALQKLMVSAALCQLASAFVSRLTIGGDQAGQTLQLLAIKAADEVRERIRDFKVELDEVSQDFRRTNESCNVLLEQRLSPCLECMTNSCKTTLSNQCSSTDTVKNVMARMRNMMREDWKADKIVKSLKHSEITYYYDLINAVSSAITHSPLNQEITGLDNEQAIVRGFPGIQQYYVPATPSQSRPSLFTRIKGGVRKALDKFLDAFKPRGCVHLENSAMRLCIQESLNLELKCTHCSQQVNPRTDCPHFEDSLSQMLLVAEKATLLNDHLIRNRNEIAFKVHSVTIFDEDDKLDITARVEVLGQTFDVTLQLPGSRYRRSEAALIKKISDAIAQRVLDTVMQ